MKAKLESKEMQYPGVSLISETEEEKQVLQRCMFQGCGPAEFIRNQDGSVALVITPNREEGPL